MSTREHKLFLPSLEADPLEELVREGMLPDTTLVYRVVFKGEDRGLYSVETIDNTEGL